MLHLLKEYAETHDIDFEVGFTSERIDWIVCFSNDGKLLGIVPYGHSMKCPNIPRTREGKYKSQFLWETAERTVLLGNEADNPQILTKQRFFVELLRKAGRDMPVLKTLADKLTDQAVLEKIRKDLSSAKPTDKITFEFGNEILLESPLWKKWWREYYDEEKQPSEIQMRCFLSGKLTNPVFTHPKINGLKTVDGEAKTALISFNRPAFCSFRLKQSENAATSPEAACAYTAALNRLIEDPQHCSIIAGTKVVHWYKKDVSTIDDPISLLNDPDAWLEEYDKVFPYKGKEIAASNSARELLESIKSGKRPKLLENQFYALTISGVRSRVMVRDWMEGPFEELVKNIQDWFDDLSITNISGKANAKDPKLGNIITCLLKPRKPNEEYKNWIKPLGSARIALWKSAIAGAPIPYSVMSKILVVNCAFWTSGEFDEARKGDNRKLPMLKSLLYTRMRLLKAYHVRKDRFNGLKESFMKTCYNCDHPDPAYHCGGMMAVLARLQEAAIPGVGAGIIQRYYAAASATPALVLGRLVRTSQFHLNKLSDKPGLMKWFENKLADIGCRIEKSIPPTLTLEQQSLFALGYYHQLADLKPNKENQSNNDKENEDE